MIGAINCGPWRSKPCSPRAALAFVASISALRAAFLLIWNRAMAKEIENPCVSRCQLKHEVCVGCGRSKEEIRGWRGMKRSEKKTTVEKAAARLKKLKKKKNKD